MEFLCCIEIFLLVLCGEVLLSRCGFFFVLDSLQLLGCGGNLLEIREQVFDGVCAESVGGGKGLVLGVEIRVEIFQCAAELFRFSVDAVGCVAVLGFPYLRGWGQVSSARTGVR